MNRRIVVAVLAFGLMVAAPWLCTAQQNTKPHITTTETETLWTRKFARCDYGFYVLLPIGMVAHANRPPNPIHGFTVALPDIGTAQQVSTERQRFIWTNAEYDASDSASAKQTVASYIDRVGTGKPGRTVTQRRVKLGTLSATRIRVEYESPAGRLVEEEVIAVRRNIVYEIGLRTTTRDYEADKQRFDNVVQGFHVWSIHYC